MPFKSTLNYSPNFNSQKRPKKQIRFIVLHYTGMKSENAAINKLTNIQSQVASHYLITRNGKIINLVPDLYIAWHAGVSLWKNLNSLNNSINWKEKPESGEYEIFCEIIDWKGQIHLSEKKNLVIQ